MRLAALLIVKTLGRLFFFSPFTWVLSTAHSPFFPLKLFPFSQTTGMSSEPCVLAGSPRSLFLRCAAGGSVAYRVFLMENMSSLPSTMLTSPLLLLSRLILALLLISPLPHKLGEVSKFIPPCLLSRLNQHLLIPLFATGKADGNILPHRNLRRTLSFGCVLVSSGPRIALL